MFCQLNIKQNVILLLLVNIFTLNELNSVECFWSYKIGQKYIDVEFWMTHMYFVIVKKMLITTQL